MRICRHVRQMVLHSRYDKDADMKEFFINCRKYWNFCSYSALCQRNSEVARTHLGWLWWLLEPALSMAVYTFVFQVIFGRKMTYLMAYISTGIMMWGFFQRNVLGSVNLVSQYSGLLKRVYMPKYILVISNMMLNGFKMLISGLIVIFFMFYYQVPLHWTVLQIIPVFLVFAVFTFGASVWLLHLGVYLPDLKKICPVILRVLFYFSGVFYDMTSHLDPALSGILLNLNPVARLMHDARNVLLYGTGCSWTALLLWLAVGIVLSVTGVVVVVRYERNYMKVI